MRRFIYSKTRIWIFFITVEQPEAAKSLLDMDNFNLVELPIIPCNKITSPSNSSASPLHASNNSIASPNLGK